MDELMEVLGRLVDHYDRLVDHTEIAEIETKKFNDTRRELEEKFGLNLQHFLGGKIDGK